MKVLVIHNAYQSHGGEDVVAEREVNLLRSAGHDVSFHQVHNNTISGLTNKLKTFANAPHNKATADWVERLIAADRPDVLHVHNFFPLLSPSLHEAAARAGVAVVQTLHNYRTICAGAHLMRNGTPCQKCITGQRLWGAVHRCYRQSLPGSFAVVAMQILADRQRTWHRHVHRFIALTDHGKTMFEQGGLPAERIVVKPNFAPESPSQPVLARHGALYVGRLSPEKGVETLLEAWAHLPGIPLTVVGDGPLRASLEATKPANVTFAGELPAEAVGQCMQAAQLLLVPSIWPEPFALVVVEAMARGLPVLASDVGGLSAVIHPGHNGALVRPGDASAIKRAVETLFADPGRLAAMGKNARRDYELHYTPQRNLHLLEGIYRQAIDLARESTFS